MSIPKLETAENGRYYAYWSEGKRSRRKSMGTADSSVATSRFAQWLMIRNATPETGSQAFTVADLWAVYDKKHVETVASPSTIRYAWKILKPHFGHLMLSDITTDVVEQYVKTRTEGSGGRRAAKPSTVRRELAALIAGINWCADPRKIKPPMILKADIPIIALPPDSEPRDRWLRTHEIDALFEAAAKTRTDSRMSRVERFLWLALETTKRLEAIMDLTWDRVDFETGMIDFDVPGRRKTKKRRGSVPISKRLFPVLKQMYNERLGKPSVKGLVMDHKGPVWATFQSIVISAGLAERQRPAGKTKRKPLATGISPHTLRHTAATHMARRGVDLFTIAGVLGNSIKMVEQVYAKHCPGKLRDAVNQISGD